MNNQETSSADKALNGAQITSVLRVLQNVKDGLLDKNQARTLLIEGLKLSQDQVNKIVG